MGHDYSLTGIPPDVKVPPVGDMNSDEVLSRALEAAR
jgi:hypothetical protein